MSSAKKISIIIDIDLQQISVDKAMVDIVTQKRRDEDCIATNGRLGMKSRKRK